MTDYRDAKIYQYWLDKEFKAYYTILETVDGQIRLIVTAQEEKL